jgi:hypothetical protein
MSFKVSAPTVASWYIGVVRFDKGLGSLAILPSPQASRERFPIARMVMRGILAAFFAGARSAHLFSPHELLKITPHWVPFAPAVIFVTGLGDSPRPT